MEGTMTVGSSVPTTAAAKQRRRRPLVVAPVCAHCRFSEVYALQVRTHCAHPNAALHGSILFAGQPACQDFVARDGKGFSLNTFHAGRTMPLV